MLYKTRIIPFFAAFIVFALFSLPSPAAEPGSLAQVRPTVGATPLSPFLDYYIDESLSMDVEEAAAPNRADLYKPLVLEALPRVEGITWLRFTLAPAPANERMGTYLLDMGQSIPGAPILYDPERNELSGALEWRENTPAQRNILLLPEAGPTPLTCYIRIDGLPGPWFSPIIRTPQDAASNWSSLSRTGAILALGVVMFLCLLRGLSENGQWRIWTALYVAAALAQAVLGMPSVSESVVVKSLAAVLCPGIALMLLPHVGRHLMRTNQRSRFLDVQLLLLSLPGAALALLPLVPQWNWLDRWVDLWPICIAIFVPTALCSWLSGLGGSRRFLLGCLIPPVFTAVSLVGLEFGVPSNLLSSGPIWGVALSALLIAATRSPWDMHENGERQEPVQETPPAADVQQEEETISLSNPLDDPNLLLATPGDTEAAEEIQSNATARELEKRENFLRGPIDDIIRDGSSLRSCPLPPSARQHVEKIISAAKSMDDLITHGDTAPEASGAQSGPFNLQKVLRGAHDAVAPAAEKNAVSLSWHMPPHLAREYRGNWRDLEKILLRLLDSSVRASSRGVVRLSARLVPESSEPGHILFTITDNGSGIPPDERSSVALASAWELARQNGGYLGMESGNQGTTIAFSLRFAPLPEDGDSAGDERHIIVACEETQERKKIISALAGLDCRVSETANMHEALVTQSIDPAPLLITSGSLAQPSAAELTRQFTEMAKQAGFSKCNILAITDDETNWPELKPSGFTHAMVAPFDADELARIAMDLASPEREGGASHPKFSQSPRDIAAEEEKTEISDKAPEPEREKEPEPEKAAPSGQIAEAQAAPDEPGHEDKPLSMLVEQDMKIVPGFEGPEWLNDIPPKKESSQRHAESSTSAAESSPLIKGPRKIVGEPEQEHGSDLEKQQEAPSRKVIKQPGGEGLEEWVGEPTPILSEKPESRDTLTDFIVGVERNESGKKAPEQANSQKEAVSEPAPKRPNSEDGEFKVEKDNANQTGIDPVIVNLVEKLDAYMNEAQKSFASQNCELLALITGQIAAESEGFGLRWLARFAKCVEQAAQASDLKAVQDLLPELAIAIERNKVALLQKK